GPSKRSGLAVERRPDEQTGGGDEGSRVANAVEDLVVVYDGDVKHHHIRHDKDQSDQLYPGPDRRGDYRGHGAGDGGGDQGAANPRAAGTAARQRAVGLSATAADRGRPAER